MSFESKLVGFIAAVSMGCDGGMVARPDTTLPDDNASRIKPPKSKSGKGKAVQDGVATASEPLVAQTAAEVMAKGGNAIDAAVAAMFMLTVVEPQSSGIGGGGFVLIHLKATNETIALNCRETAPAAATPHMFVSQPDPFLRISSGYAVGVPGMVACAATMLENWGTISLAEALAPAIEAATNGVVVSSRLANEVRLPNLANEPGNPAYDLARAVFHPAGQPVKAGDLLVQPDLAYTFELLAEFGPDAFYQCDHPAGIAQAIVNAQLVTRTANPDGEGRMTCADLAAYQVEIRAPISRTYRGYEIVSAPPPTSGGIAVLQILAMLERFPIGEDGFGFGEVTTLNVMLEAVRLAFADRAFWVGDDHCPGCTDVPVKGLLGDAYLTPRASMIEVGKRRTGITAGNPTPYDLQFGAVKSIDEPIGDTSHVSIVDTAGNMVSPTMSVEATWGSGIMVPGFGFLLNNELTDFNILPTYNPDPRNFDPGANDVAPFKQPRSGMAPTMVFLDGEPIAAYGSPGGATIINTVANVTLNLIDHRMTLWESVLAPRISIINADDAAFADRECGFDREVILALQALGYQFNLLPAIGAAQVVLQLPGSGKRYGAADPRRIGGVYAVD